MNFRGFFVLKVGFKVQIAIRIQLKDAAFGGKLPNRGQSKNAAVESPIEIVKLVSSHTKPSTRLVL